MYEAIVNRTIAAMLSKDDADTKEVLDSKSAGSRTVRNRTAVDYSAFLGNDGDSERSLEKYLKAVAEREAEREQQRSCTATYNPESLNRDADIRVSVKNRMMDLRKATNHPYLIEYPLTPDGSCYRIDQDLVDICGKFKVLDQLLEALLEKKHKVLIFSQMTKMLDILGDYLMFKVSFSRGFLLPSLFFPETLKTFLPRNRPTKRSRYHVTKIRAA